MALNFQFQDSLLIMQMINYFEIIFCFSLYLPFSLAAKDKKPANASVDANSDDNVAANFTLLDAIDDAEEVPQEHLAKTDQGVLCKVVAKRPYSRSPEVFLKNIKTPYNSALVGYDTHRFGRRSDKGSLYGWSGGRSPDADGNSSFTFDLDYATILPQSGTPLSYCALIFTPPIAPKFDISKVFGKPALALSRYIGSQLHFSKALRKRGKLITTCCFTAFPMVAY
ncbi:hypothetical protein BmR1_04g09585 [Babesia microti strain RI]|uniref:Uncharacterized protein n=1 Tax=Babesia microti (strain RI) TaxID=1133968 RepID=I7IT59_BABMR|nr:hypothetical protein BmR1_04g09585 [Babesia microti strain RI]CCF76086.1 hypothetical protein BmR1_04g09585 [Babesia microti strain RI]|eukprot:XP_012650494.1 hypothetical protein BmR1_04g09585 [Babesia microti strain RI]